MFVLLSVIATCFALVVWRGAQSEPSRRAALGTNAESSHPFITTTSDEAELRPTHECADLARLASRTQRCLVARKFCRPYGFANYLAFYHCHSSAVVWSVRVMLILFLMYMLGEIAEGHFCPSLEYLSAYLRISPAVAGPTLLAFGNGSPDVSATLIGLVSHKGAKELGLNSPLGVGLFVTSVVVAVVTLVSPVEIDRVPFLRDTGFYIAALLLLCYIIADGLIHVAEAVGMLTMYGIYVIVVVFGDRLMAMWFGSNLTAVALESLADLVSAMPQYLFRSAPCNIYRHNE